jgi:hypothetical protein
LRSKNKRPGGIETALPVLYDLTMRRISITCFIFLFAIACDGQSTWVKRISNSDVVNSGINCWSVTTINNTVNIVFNEAFEGFYKFCIVQMDMDGEVLAYNYYGEDGVFEHTGWANSADISHEGGLINGGSYSIDNGPGFGHFKCFDENATLLWETFYGDTVMYEDGTFRKNIFRQIKATSDGGYIAVGQIGTVQYHPQIWVLKTDGAGNFEWQNFFGGTGPNDYYDGYHIAEMPDGSFVLAGYYDWQPYVTTGILIKINAQGNFITSATTSLGSIPNNVAEGLLILENGDIITSTRREFVNDMNIDVRVTRVHRLNSELQPVWVSEIGENEFLTTANHFLMLEDNAVLAVGTTRHFGMSTLRKGHLTKVNLGDGSIIWQRTLSAVDNGINYMFDVDNTPDGGFVAAGYCLAVPGDEFPGQQDAWVVKVDQHGCLVPDCHVGVQESENENGVRMLVYPNPVKDILNVYLETSPPPPLQGRGGASTMSLIDMQGRTVKQWPADGFATTYMVDVSGLGAGVYVLRNEGGGVVLTEKIVIER